MKRTRLSPISKKRSNALKEYRKLREEYLHLNRTCEAGLVLAAEGIECGCKKWATEIHHTAKRRKNLNNVNSWLPVCSNCHRWIEDNKARARELNLLRNIHDC